MCKQIHKTKLQCTVRVFGTNGLITGILSIPTILRIKTSKLSRHEHEIESRILIALFEIISSFDSHQIVFIFDEMP